MSIFKLQSLSKSFLSKKYFSSAKMVQHKRYEIEKMIIPNALRHPVTLGSSNVTAKNRFLKVSAL